MWTARVLTESGKDEDLPVEFVGQRQALTTELIPLARNLADKMHVRVPWHILDAIASSTPSVWADPISSWAGRAAEELQTFFVTRSRGENGEVALESKESGIQFWHESTAVVVVIPDGSDQLAIEYQWDDWIPYPSRLANYGPDPEGELPPTLDCRLYSGEKSVILEADSLPQEGYMPPEMLQDRKPVFRWYFKVKRRAGLLIGRIVRRLLRRPAPITRDPGFLMRLTDEERRLDPLAAKCPRIENVADASPDTPLVVVVHGTFSCAVQMAVRIREVRPGLQVARFEHDTFLPITENIRALTQELQRLAVLGQRKVLLIAHSRGGLVACQAAAHLRSSQPAMKVKVWTFGTPHCGTPLASLSGNLAQGIGALYRLCARQRDGAFYATYAEGAASYLTAVGQLPRGISVMSEGSDFLDVHRLSAEGLDLKTWGAQYEIATDSGIGHGMLLSPAVSEMFDGRLNDLVVPTDSAILDHSASLQSCNHFQYFDHAAFYLALESMSF
jgi:pimeloyl-ACP methyl ester carboxylesterase